MMVPVSQSSLLRLDSWYFNLFLKKYREYPVNCVTHVCGDALSGLSKILNFQGLPEVKREEANKGFLDIFLDYAISDFSYEKRVLYSATFFSEKFRGIEKVILGNADFGKLCLQLNELTPVENSIHSDCPYECKHELENFEKAFNALHNFAERVDLESSLRQLDDEDINKLCPDMRVLRDFEIAVSHMHLELLSYESNPLKIPKSIYHNSRCETLRVMFKQVI